MPRSKSLLFLPLLVLSLVLGMTMAVATAAHETGWASSAGGAATIHPPKRAAGASGYRDARDVDLYPTVAFDRSTGRYLAVWLTARNAMSPADGFDLFGVFLDGGGQPASAEFRISDYNTVARNGQPAVVAGTGAFAVAWTAKEASCRIYVQQVVDGSPRTDRVLASGPEHHHSPSLAYNPVRQRFVLAYVAGDDYLPPTFAGADTADCGNNASSTSRIQVAEFQLSGDGPLAGAPLDVSDVGQGAFRPAVAYSPTLNQYLVAWEDRRNAGAAAYRLDIYAQRLDGDLSSVGDDIVLASGDDYANTDPSATWTPRPAIAGGDRFLTTWFSRRTEGAGVLWSAMGSLLASSGPPGAPFTIVRVSFSQPHPGNAPSGFLSAVHANTAGEYLVGIASQIESLWGYFSQIRIQRLDSEGQLLAKDGSLQGAPGVGSSVDYQNADQVAVALAVNPVSGASQADYMAVYAKHRTDQTPQDFDMWSVRVQIPALSPTRAFLPIASKNSRGVPETSGGPD